MNHNLSLLLLLTIKSGKWWIKTVKLKK